MASWQRWTIDEIDADIARLAIASAFYPLESSVAEAEALGDDPDAIRQQVTKVEFVAPDDLWADEEAVYVNVRQLTEFLKRRDRIRGLPDNRPLREGDVFWIVLPVGDQGGVRALDAPQLIADVDWAGVEVWDVTAAARQVAKHSYDSALRAASDEPSGPELLHRQP
jgi:hypothetical protein